VFAEGPLPGPHARSRSHTSQPLGKNMSESKSTATASGGGLGCLGLIIILSLVAWAGLEMEPRPAVWWGIKWTLYTYLAFFGIIIAIALGVIGLGMGGSNRRNKRGW